MDVEEIEICRELIDEFYPLYSRKTFELLPWLCCCVKLKHSKMFKKISSEFSKLSEEEDEGDWKLDDLREMDERLSKFIKDAGAKPFEGTDFV